METPEYPPNRFTNPEKPPPPPGVEKDIKRVTTGEPQKRKKSLGKQFKQTFFNGDGKTAANYVVFGVLVPAAKDAIVDAAASGVERLVFGESRRRRGPTAPPSGPTGVVNYNRPYSMMGRPQDPPVRMSRRARAQHDFDEIVLTSRAEAEDVIERMFDVLNKYESVNVADFYTMVGLPSAHTDYKWGWTDLRGAGVVRVRTGYLLDLPEPVPFT